MSRLFGKLDNIHQSFIDLSITQLNLFDTPHNYRQYVYFIINKIKCELN